MSPSNPTPPEKPTPRRAGGIEFKPWPLPYFLVSLAASAMMFVIESFLPKGTVPYSSLVGGAMAAMTMSYLSYCGYSVWTSPPKTKMLLVMVFITVAMVTASVSAVLLGSAA